MLAARATSAASLRNARPCGALAVASGRVALRALSAKLPEKPVPSPEEEAEKQATQIRAMEVILAANESGKSKPCDRACC